MTPEYYHFMETGSLLPTLMHIIRSLANTREQLRDWLAPLSGVTVRFTRNPVFGDLATLTLNLLP